MGIPGRSVPLEPQEEDAHDAAAMIESQHRNYLDCGVRHPKQSPTIFQDPMESQSLTCHECGVRYQPKQIHDCTGKVNSRYIDDFVAQNEFIGDLWIEADSDFKNYAKAQLESISSRKDLSDKLSSWIDIVAPRWVENDKEDALQEIKNARAAMNGHETWPALAQATYTWLKRRAEIFRHYHDGQTKLKQE